MEGLVRLFDRATGGRDVAANPNNVEESYFPEGTSPAGIDAAVDWFEHQSQAGTHSLLFLVGAPGGGKSHVARRIVSRYEEKNPQTIELDHRKYIFETTGRPVVLLNDATIRSEKAVDGELKLDVESAIKNGENLVACVNRGILVEELSSTNGFNSVTIDLVGWLASGQIQPAQSSLVKGTTSEYLQTATLRFSESVNVEVCVVYVDVCSLFEVTPSAELENPVGELPKLKAKSYEVADFTKRNHLPGTSVPAIKLFQDVVQKVGNSWDFEKFEFDPIGANLRSLSESVTLSGLGSVLRASELASGQRYSYREVWGLIARCLAADLPKRISRENVEKHLTDLQTLGSSPEDKFESIMALADLRYSQSLFEVFGGNLVLNGKRNRDPISRLTTRVDPILDSQPGLYSLSEANSGWANPLIDAFAGSFGAESPLSAALKNASENADDNFEATISKFEWQLDSAFCDLMSWPDLKDQARTRAITWYSCYLSRLYAVSNGIPAFREQISILVNLWRYSPTIDADTRDRILTVLRPYRNPQANSPISIIPIFDSRTLPMAGYLPAPKLGVKLTDVQVKSKRAGDHTHLLVEEAGAVVAEVPLDFPFLRDALSSNSGFVGLTELSASMAPRLERLRASRLSPDLFSKSQNDLFVVQGSEETQFIFRGGN